MTVQLNIFILSDRAIVLVLRNIADELHARVVLFALKLGVELGQVLVECPVLRSGVSCADAVLYVVAQLVEPLLVLRNAKTS